MSKSLTLLAIVALVVGGSYSAEKNWKPTAKPVVMPEQSFSTEKAPAIHHDVPPAALPPVGTYTTLTGYFDYQANGTPQSIRVNPANGNIHVTYMVATDSAAPNGASRRTAYAFSSNGGVTWNNFNDLYIPARRSGFPSIDLLKGPNAGLPVIGNHNVAGAPNIQSMIYVDSPEGAGAFSELNAPPLLDPSASDEPIWPFVAGANDGSIVIHSSRSTANTNHLNRTADFTSWQFPAPWKTFTGPNGSGGRNATVANGVGRVATIINAVSPDLTNPADGGLYLFESTDNGSTWGSSVTIHPPFRIVGADTFGMWVSADITYDGNNVLAALNTSRLDLSSGGLYYDAARIEFWSAATGLVVAVPHDTSLFVNDMNGFAQTNHLTLGGPSIAKSGNSIVIVFQAFQRDTAPNGFRYSDVWYTVSNNNGVTWSRPVNITRTAAMDERYPSISKYNQPGFANVVWQEDPQPGAYAPSGPDPGALGSRNRQVFYKITLTDVQQGASVPAAFGLAQNYPNPFNPTTKIRYSLPAASNVGLRVYNTLGQLVATLVDGYRTAGEYEVEFSAKDLPSGVYYYTLKAGSFAETKKMLLVR